jgi:hypothetical protein
MEKEDVHVWDEDKQENFNLQALLFITINDWPALSNLSGHSNKGYRACTHCLFLLKIQPKPKHELYAITWKIFPHG